MTSRSRAARALTHHVQNCLALICKLGMSSYRIRWSAASNHVLLGLGELTYSAKRKLRLNNAGLRSILTKAELYMSRTNSHVHACLALPASAQVYLDIGICATAFKPAGERTLGDRTVLPEESVPAGRIVLGKLFADIGGNSTFVQQQLHGMAEPPCALYLKLSRKQNILCCCICNEHSNLAAACLQPA